MSMKVFLSYAFQDHALVESIKTRINDFLPPHGEDEVHIIDAQIMDVAAGENIRQSIRAAIEEANTVLIISSVNGDASAWVNYEAGLADAMGKNLVIVGVEGTGSALMNRFYDTATIVKVEND